MKPLILIGQPDLGIIPFSDNTVSVKLAAAVPIVIEVPEGATTALFSCGVEYFVAENAAASVPTATPTAGVMERNPALRAIEPSINTLGVVSTNIGYMTVSFYG